MLKKVIYLSDLTKCGVNFDFHTKLGKKVFIAKKKVGPPRKMTSLSGLRFFNCKVSNFEELVTSP